MAQKADVWAGLVRETVQSPDYYEMLSLYFGWAAASKNKAAAMAAIKGKITAAEYNALDAAITDQEGALEQFALLYGAHLFGQISEPPKSRDEFLRVFRKLG